MAAEDRKHVTSLVGRLVSSVTRDAACELGRIYEYQLALLGDGQAGAMLAAHAARCVIDYVICGGRYLELETIVMGAVKGQARPTNPGPMPVVSVIVGERELKWRLDDILKKPGLRLETYLCSDDYQVCNVIDLFTIIYCFLSFCCGEHRERIAIRPFSMLLIAALRSSSLRLSVYLSVSYGL